jgi:hypothetical protein
MMWISNLRPSEWTFPEERHDRASTMAGDRVETRSKARIHSKRARVRLAGGRRELLEESGGGIDHDAQQAGEVGFARAFGPLDDEDGALDIGDTGGDEPCEAAEPIDAVG